MSLVLCVCVCVIKQLAFRLASVHTHTHTHYKPNTTINTSTNINLPFNPLFTHTTPTHKHLFSLPLPPINRSPLAPTWLPLLQLLVMGSIVGVTPVWR